MTLKPKSILYFASPLLAAIGLGIYVWATAPVREKVSKEVNFTQTDLPLVLMNTQGHRMQTDKRHRVELVILNNESAPNYADTLSHPNQRIVYSGEASMRYHGSSSYRISPKKAYNVKLKHSTPLLEMQTSRCWFLYAPFIDRSCLRDKLTYDLFRPMFPYLPHMQPVEVVVNGEYKGIYYLLEKISKNKQGLNISESGHIVKLGRQERYQGELANYVSRYRAKGSKVYYSYVYPDLKQFKRHKGASQKDVDASLSEMEDALKEGSLQHIDLPSFATYYLATEFIGNADGFRNNLYFYKQRKSDTYKLLLWDNDRTFGNSYRHHNDDWTRWIHETGWDFDRNIPFYWHKIIATPEFQAEIRRQWKEMRQTILTEEHIYSLIQELHQELCESGAQQRNDQAYALWTRGRFLPMTSEQGRFTCIDQELDYIRNWVHHRLLFMDEQILYPDPTIQR